MQEDKQKDRSESRIFTGDEFYLRFKFFRWKITRSKATFSVMVTATIVMRLVGSLFCLFLPCFVCVILIVFLFVIVWLMFLDMLMVTSSDL